MIKTPILLLLSLAALSPLQAQENAAEAEAPLRLTLETCIEQAKANNRSIAAATKQWEAARYEARSMKANFLPSLSAGATALYADAEAALSVPGGMLPVLGADGKPTGASAYFPGIDLGMRTDWIFHGGLTLEAPLYAGGKVRTGYRMACIGTELAAQQRRLTEQEVVVATSQAYADVLRARELRQVAQRYHDLLEALLHNVTSARKHGMKPQNDVLRVQVKVNESALQLRRAENGLRLATMNLCHLTGHRLTERIEVTDELPEDRTEAAPDLSRRPETRLLAGQRDLAEQQIRLARSERLPQVGLIGQYGYTRGLEVNGDPLFDGANFAAGVQVKIPIFHFGGRTNRLRAARAKYEQARLAEQRGDEQMQLEAVRAANNLDEATLEVELAASTLAAAEENLRLSRRRYEAGTETLSDHLEAQTLWQQACATHVEARVNAYLCHLTYRKAAGLLE